MREQYVLKEEIKNNTSIDLSYCGGIFGLGLFQGQAMRIRESEKRSYVFKTKGTWFQTPKLPAGVQLNVPAGSTLPLIPGGLFEPRMAFAFPWILGSMIQSLHRTGFTIRRESK